MQGHFLSALDPQVRLSSPGPAEPPFGVPEQCLQDCEFMLYGFKVMKCPVRCTHDWKACPFAHPTENARRRDPRVHAYQPIPCPDYKNGLCLKGDLCEFSHGVYEAWLHPARYRTQMCKDGANCRRPVCFFAHTAKELRQPTHPHAHATDAAADGNLRLKLLPGPASPVSVQHFAAGPESPGSPGLTGDAAMFSDGPFPGMLSSPRSPMHRSSLSSLPPERRSPERPRRSVSLAGAEDAAYRSCSPATPQGSHAFAHDFVGDLFRDAQMPSSPRAAARGPHQPHRPQPGPGPVQNSGPRMSNALARSLGLLPQKQHAPRAPPVPHNPAWLSQAQQVLSAQVRLAALLQQQQQALVSSAGHAPPPPSYLTVPHYGAPLAPLQMATGAPALSILEQLSQLGITGLDLPGTPAALDSPYTGMGL